jgi:divalent metal cation (Fe/Co/Zn/Cd) transporter
MLIAHITAPIAHSPMCAGFMLAYPRMAEWRLLKQLRRRIRSSRPEPFVMGAIGTLALARNDVLGNLAVLLAALGVFGTGTMWPDIVVAAVMAGLALQGSAIVMRHSFAELRVAGT